MIRAARRSAATMYQSLSQDKAIHTVRAARRSGIIRAARRSAATTYQSLSQDKAVHTIREARAAR